MRRCADEALKLRASHLEEALAALRQKDTKDVATSTEDIIVEGPVQAETVAGALVFCQPCTLQLVVLCLLLLYHMDCFHVQVAGAALLSNLLHCADTLPAAPVQCDQNLSSLH